MAFYRLGGATVRTERLCLPRPPSPKKKEETEKGHAVDSRRHSIAARLVKFLSASGYLYANSFKVDTRRYELYNLIILQVNGLLLARLREDDDLPANPFDRSILYVILFLLCFIVLVQCHYNVVCDESLFLNVWSTMTRVS